MLMISRFFSEKVVDTNKGHTFLYGLNCFSYAADGYLGCARTRGFFLQHLPWQKA
jgi:hypothetical protein